MKTELSDFSRVQALQLLASQSGFPRRGKLWRLALFISRGRLSAAAVLALTLTAQGAVTEFEGIGGIAITDNANAAAYPSTCTAGGITATALAVEKSTDLTNFDPFPFLAPQMTVRPDGKIEFFFTAPDNAEFFRLGTE